MPNTPSTQCLHIWNLDHEDDEGYVHCSQPGCGAVGDECDECDGEGCAACGHTGYVEVPQSVGG